MKAYLTSATNITGTSSLCLLLIFSSFWEDDEYDSLSESFSTLAESIFYWKNNVI